MISLGSSAFARTANKLYSLAIFETAVIEGNETGYKSDYHCILVILHQTKVAMINETNSVILTAPHYDVKKQ